MPSTTIFEELILINFINGKSMAIDYNQWVLNPEWIYVNYVSNWTKNNIHSL